MRFSSIIAGASLASLTIAAPLEKRAYTTEWVVEVVTSTSTVYPAAAKSTPAPVPGAFLQGAAPVAPVVHHTTSKAPAAAPPAPSPAPVYTPPAANPPASSGSDGWKNVNPNDCLSGSAAEAAASGSSPSSCGASWLDTINAARQGYGKSTLKWDQSLANFAGNVASTSPFHHNDLQGSISGGEIMAGGELTSDGNLHGTTPFGVAVAMWLCEIPGASELSSSGFSGINLCQAFGFGGGSTTLHNQILLGDYHNVGCKHGSAGYVCDFN